MEKQKRIHISGDLVVRTVTFVNTDTAYICLNMERDCISIILWANVGPPPSPLEKNPGSIPAEAFQQVTSTSEFSKQLSFI